MISEKAMALLRVIHQECDIDWATGEVKKFFIPPAGRKIVWLREPSGSLTEFYVSDAGMASSFRALESRGLIKRRQQTGAYSAVVTEEGHLAVERWAEKAGAQS